MHLFDVKKWRELPTSMVRKWQVVKPIFDGSKPPGHANDATDAAGLGFCRFKATLFEDIWGIMCVYIPTDLKTPVFGIRGPNRIYGYVDVQKTD